MPFLRIGDTAWRRSDELVYVQPYSFVTLAIVSLILTPIFSCWTTREPDAPYDQPAAAQDARAAVPRSIPDGEIIMTAEPTGTLDTEPTETGLFFLHPSTLVNPQVFVHAPLPSAKGCCRITSTTRCWVFWPNRGRLPTTSLH